MKILRLFCLIISSFILLGVADAPSYAQMPIGHPHLWLTEADLPALRAIATPENPLWVELLSLAEGSVALMDSGILPVQDIGDNSWVEYPNENHALLLAFVSLVHPDEAIRADYASRARTLLMYIIEQASLGVAEDTPFRRPDFALTDRSRWYGASFGLVVDWIYPILTAEDKGLIATVFTRWCDENRNAYTTNNNRPEPIGVVNDPQLLQDKLYHRWSNNNYYTAHMRNMGLMSLSLNPEDDPTGALATCLNEAMGAWLYVFDNSMRTDTLGGLGAEGFEYSPQTLGYTAQFLLALYTSGYADTYTQTSFENNPYWEDAITAYLHSMSPAPHDNQDYGQVYVPAWYGSGQHYYMPDHIALFGALGQYARLTGDAETLNATRWIQQVSAPGGESGLLSRMDYEQYIHPILYFLLFRPDEQTPSDPRPSLPTTYYAPGLRRLLARTDWSPDATWFTYNLTWATVDHQSANGNAVELYRGGEWLTQVRVGYDLDYLSSDNQNTLLVQNNPPSYDDWRYMLYERGSQWLYIPSGDPNPPTWTEGDGYIAITGDATPLYNSDYAESTSVMRVVRQIVWLKPDVLVIYDLAQTQNNGFKRFVLNLPADATITDNTAVMTTVNGNQLSIINLSPTATDMSVVLVPDEISEPPASYQTMTHRYIASTTDNPTEAYFLHVLVGADSGGVLPTITLVDGTSTAPVVQIGERTITFDGVNITVSP
ncbi:MAG: hypothetical protein SFZ02_17855 [bacterium]|nr:hypothetical protein [bacterium]